ncbi:MAG: hypothetical protein LBG24_03970 [Treponema sp.]|nr:hypothetical protein [Treponema sp.]
MKEKQAVTREYKTRYQAATKQALPLSCDIMPYLICLISDTPYDFAPSHTIKASLLILP